MKQRAFESELAYFLQAFLDYKHALGISYETGEIYLHKFDRYYAGHASADVTLAELANRWVMLRDGESPTTQHSRVATIRQLGIFLRDSKCPVSFMISKKTCQKQVRTMPHFFNDDEITRFFDVCDTLKPRKENPIRHFVLPMLFRLLYCCGLRTCEARLVLRENVNLTLGYVDVFRSKGPKDRRVFLPEDLWALFRIYDAKVDSIQPDRKYFFPSTPDSCYASGSTSENFNVIWKAAGLANSSGTKARAYDFRHHFAFANLNRWIEGGIDVNSKLPYLMRCMGHSNLESTFYYLHLVPEFFTTFSDRTKALEVLLPEVGYEEEE